MIARVQLLDLPDIIIEHLQSFLSKDDIHYFLNCNKLHFSSLKQGTIYFSLNTKKSQQYVEDEEFREMILSKVKNGSKQIGLTFDMSYEVPDIGDIIAHMIRFCEYYPRFPDKVSSMVFPLPNEIKEIPFLPMLQELELSNCKNIQDFSSLSRLKKLELRNATLLTDISPLQNIPHLRFIGCPNIRNFSILNSQNQESVVIRQCPISDISFLRNMKMVYLGQCNKIIDVSPLYGVKRLFLSHCAGIQDISSLGNHHRLTIDHCTSIERGFECCRTVRHAQISGSKVPDLNVFREVKSLAINVSRSTSMENQLLLLKDIPHLELIVAEYPERKEVYDVSHMRNTRLTFYEDIIKIHDSNFPSKLLHLKLVNCNRIVKIIDEGKTSVFRHLQSLHLASCPILDVNGLGDIPTVILECCEKLYDISGLGRNRCVELRYCPNIRDVSSLTTVPIITISNCKRIANYSCLSKVPRSKIVEYW